MPEVTRRLAAFAVEHPGDVAPAVGQHVRRAVLDLLGVMVLGAHEPAATRALAYARSQAAPGPATVVGGGVRLAPSLAALVNGTAGHALDLDDIGLGAGHISVAVLPAVLAIAEQLDAPGDRVCDAVAIGYEVASRLTRMYGDPRLGPYAAGYHKPSVYSAFGATAAVGRLLGLTADQLAHAFGITASESGGLRVNFGTMTKPLHAGLSNRTAIEAALLAREGFSASPEALEGRFGWHDVICRGEGDLELVLAGLGGSLALEEGLLFKAYPSCGANHHAIDATARLVREHGLSVPEVARVDVAIEARNLREVLVYPWPRSPLEGKFSLAYNVAAALADGAVTVATFTDDTLARLTPLRERIVVHPREDLPANGAEVAITTTDDRRFERRQLVVRGSLDDPMSWDELAAKFTANVRATVGDDTAAAVVALVRDLGPGSSIPELMAPLLVRPPATPATRRPGRRAAPRHAARG